MHLTDSTQTFPKVRVGPETDFNRRCRTSISILQFTAASSFVRALTCIFTRDRTALLMSRPNCAPTWPAVSLSNLALICLPAEWPRRKSRIIRYLVAERLTNAFKPHGIYPARELGRKTGREALVYRISRADLKEKALDVRLRNPFGVELCRLNIAIKQGNRQQVGKAMIGVFLVAYADVGLWTEASTASEVISVLDHIGFDAHDLGGIKWVDLI